MRLNIFPCSTEVQQKHTHNKQLRFREIFTLENRTVGKFYTKEHIESAIEEISHWDDAFKVSKLEQFFGRTLPYRWGRSGRYSIVTASQGEYANKAEVLEFLRGYISRL